MRNPCTIWSTVQVANCDLTNSFAWTDCPYYKIWCTVQAPNCECDLNTKVNLVHILFKYKDVFLAKLTKPLMTYYWWPKRTDADVKIKFVLRRKPTVTYSSAINMCHLLDRSMWKLIQFHEKLAKSQVIDVAGDTHCGNCGNLLSIFFSKTFVKVKFLLKKY